MNINQLPRHLDSRGAIQAVMENCRVGSISFITSEAGTERASHWHKDPEGHTILIVGGELWIYERPVGSLEKPTLTVLGEGDLHWTGPNVEHTMYFPEKNSFYCYSVLPRDSETYESNTIRIPVSLRAIYDSH